MPEVFIKPKLAERKGFLLTEGNDYVVVPDKDTEKPYFFVKGYKSKIIQLVCTEENLLYKIDASLDLESWHQIKAEDTLNADAITYETNTEPWNYIKVQIKPKVGTEYGKMAVTIEMSSL